MPPKKEPPSKFLAQTSLPPQQPRGFLESLINKAGIAAPRPPERGNNQAVANRWIAAQANQRRRMRQVQAREWQENVRAGIAPSGTTRAPEAPLEGIRFFPQGLEVPSIRWGPAPIYTKPKPFRWGGIKFNAIPIETQNTLTKLYKIVHSPQINKRIFEKYKQTLDIFEEPIDFISRNTINTNQELNVCKEIIRKYWGDITNQNHIIESIEICSFILNWFQENTIFENDIFVIFPVEIAGNIKRLIRPVNDSNLEFKISKINYIKQLYQFPEGNSQEILNRYFNGNDQNINTFKISLQGEINERIDIINELYV
jgi:hypothetical protein